MTTPLPFITKARLKMLRTKLQQEHADARRYADAEGSMYPRIVVENLEDTLDALNKAIDADDQLRGAA